MKETSSLKYGIHPALLSDKRRLSSWKEIYMRGKQRTWLEEQAIDQDSQSCNNHLKWASGYIKKGFKLHKENVISKAWDLDALLKSPTAKLQKSLR